MTKQRTCMAVVAAVLLGILGSGCSSNNDAVANKTPAQVQTDAQQVAAGQAKMYQQKMGQQGQK